MEGGEEGVTVMATVDGGEGEGEGVGEEEWFMEEDGEKLLLLVPVALNTQKKVHACYMHRTVIFDSNVSGSSRSARLIQTTLYSSAFPAWKKYLPNES